MLSSHLTFLFLQESIVKRWYRIDKEAKGQMVDFKSPGSTEKPYEKQQWHK